MWVDTKEETGTGTGTPTGKGTRTNTQRVWVVVPDVRGGP